MSNVRNLVAKMPYIAGCVDADRFATRNLLIFDTEISKEDSIYAYRGSDTVNNRLAVLDIPDEYIVNKRVYEASKKRLRICLLSCDSKKGRITDDQEEELRQLIGDAKNNPVSEVDEAMPLEVAVMGVWS